MGRTLKRPVQRHMEGDRIIQKLAFREAQLFNVSGTKFGFFPLCDTTPTRDTENE